MDWIQEVTLSSGFYSHVLLLVHLRVQLHVREKVSVLQESTSLEQKLSVISNGK